MCSKSQVAPRSSSSAIDDGAIAEKIRDIFGGGVDRVLELVGASTPRDSLASVAPRGIVCMTGMLRSLDTVELEHDEPAVGGPPRSPRPLTLTAAGRLPILTPCGEQVPARAGAMAQQLAARSAQRLQRTTTGSRQRRSILLLAPR